MRPLAVSAVARQIEAEREASARRCNSRILDSWLFITSMAPLNSSIAFRRDALLANISSPLDAVTRRAPMYVKRDPPRNNDPALRVPEMPYRHGLLVFGVRPKRPAITPSRPPAAAWRVISPFI